MVHLPSLFPVSPLEMATFAAVGLPRTNTGKSCHNSPENGDHCLDIFSGLAAGTHFRNFCPDQGVRWTKFSLFQAEGTHFRNFCPDQRVRWTKFSIFQAPGTHFRKFCPESPRVVKSDVYRSNEGQAEGPAWLTKQVLINSWQLKDVAVCSGPAWSQPCRCGLIVVCVMATFGLHDEGAKVPGDLGAVLLHSAEVRPRGGAFPLEGIWPKLPRGCRRRDRGRSRHGARSRCRTCT